LDYLNLGRILQGYNPWWAGKPLENLPPFHRRDFYHLQKTLDEKSNAIVISGPRQVGKTTLVKQLIAHLLSQLDGKGGKKYEPNRILYATPELITSVSGSNPIGAILQTYEEIILGEKLTSPSKPTFIFIDEAQKAPEWAETIKPYLDASKGMLKFTITGSSRLSLIEKSSERLPGRHFQYLLLPLKFADRLKLRAKNPEKIEKLLIRARGFRDDLLRSIDKKDAAIAQVSATRIVLSIDKETENFVNQELQNHLREGGYPEIVTLESSQEKYQRFETYVSDIVSRDMEHSRKPELARRLFVNLSKLNAQQVKESELRQSVYGQGTGSPTTIQNYLLDLEQLPIIRRVYRNQSNKNTRQRKPKIYFCDTGLRNSAIGYLDGEISDTENGFLAETVALDHLLRLLFKAKGHSGNVYFAKEDDQSKEIDFIVRDQADKAFLAVEVKYRNSFDSSDLQEMTRARKENPGLFCVALTKNSVSGEKGMLVLPLWLFLCCA